MSKKQKTTSTQTSTPTNPEWVTQGAQNLNSTIQGLGAKDPTSYVAGANPLLTQAASNAGSLGTSPYYGQAADIFGKAAEQTTNPVQASSLLDGLQNYMNPYTKDVVDTTLADFDYNAGQQRAQAQLDEANSGAFGGSGAAITRSMLGDTLARARASTAAGLRSDAFNTGAGLSAQDAGMRQQAALANQQAQMADLQRQLQAAGGLAGLGAQQGQDQRANVGLQGTLGGQLQAIDQAKAQAPLTLAQLQSSMFSGLPLNLFNGNTTTGSSTTKISDPMGTLSQLLQAGGSAAQGAAALAALSDVRVKRDIETVGYDDKGRRIVDFKYLWSPQVYRGHIAQEILESDPHAVIQGEDGLLRINYGALA